MSKQHESNSRFFKFIGFLSLTDTEVLNQCGRYDRMLAYAMVFRQLVTFIFTFLLFTYGVSLFLSMPAAIVSGLIFALTLFFLDQAIIGSDWALRNPFKGGLPLRSLVGLLPRIAYSLIIAIGLATLAEISLQSTAIDEQIQKETNENNREYFNRLAAHEAELNSGIAVTRTRIEDIQDRIKSLRTQQNIYRDTEQVYDEQTLSNSIGNQQNNLAELEKARQTVVAEIASLNERLVKARADYAFWFNEALLERTGQDGRAPTEGPKYKRAVATYTDIEQQIGLIEASIEAAKTSLLQANADIDEMTDQMNTLQQKKNLLAEKRGQFSENDLTLTELQNSLSESEQTLALQIEQKQQKMDAHREKLVRDGLFFDPGNGLLRRYLGLQSIHNDPVYGPTAVLFSHMLKIFFIAIELMPVIIKLFFSPFSFYGLRMYRRMEVALLQERMLLEQAQKHHRDKHARLLTDASENTESDDFNNGRLPV